MQKFFNISRSNLLVAIVLLVSSILFAQTTGKIRGNVIDATSGEVLPFANIIIEGTTMGAPADLNGEFIIMNVPVGTHTLVASMMGYADMKIENVKVSVNMTTTVNFRLQRTAIKGEEVVVKARRPIIQRDVTTSERRMSGKEITQMPVKDYGDVVALQTGAMETGRSRSGGLHIRGGRSDEVLFVVDGINTTDPVSGTPGAIIDNNAIAEMLVISGGFDAEYGKAMSGVVNIVTREGGRKYSGSLKYTTDALFKEGTSLHKPTAEKFFNQGYNFGFQDASLIFGGPVPLLKKVSFFSSLGYNDYSKTYYPHSDQKEQKATLKLGWRLSNSLKATLATNYAYREYHSYQNVSAMQQRPVGAWWDDMPLFQKGNSQINLKITHSITPRTFYNLNIGRFNTYTKYSSQNGKHYNDFEAIGEYLPWVSVAHDSGWYNPKTKEWNLEGGADRAWMWYYEQIGVGHWNHNTGQWIWDTNDPAKIVDALTSRRYETGSYVAGNPISSGDVKVDSIMVDDTTWTYIYYHKFNLDQYIRDVKTFISDTTDTLDKEFMEPSGNLYLIRYNDDEWGRFAYYFSPRWHDRNTIRNSVSFQLVSQVNKYNEIKTGLELENHELSYTSVAFVNNNPYLDHYNKYPFTADFYISDKIEYEDMILKLGARADYFNPKDSFYIHMDTLQAGKEEVKPKWQVSPRFAISYAVSDRAIMYANYGHFFQPLNFADIYQNLNADITTGWPTIGNPNLPPQKEIMYEGGFRYAFTPDMAGEISAYFKDVKTLLTTRKETTVFNKQLATYSVYELQDFALVKGIDLTFTKRASRFLSGTASYSFQQAKGTGSSPSEAFYFYIYYGAVGEPPTREFPLEYDITHTIKTNLNLYFPDKWGPGFAQIHPLSDINTNLQFVFASGAPYTPTALKGGSLEVGSRRMPSIIMMDMRIDKGFKIGNIDLSLFATINNLLNIKNVADVYRATGEPDNPGLPPVWDSTYYESMYESYLKHNDDYKNMYGYTSAEDMYEKNVENWEAYYDDLTHYLNPRIIRVGIEFKF